MPDFPTNRSIPAAPLTPILTYPDVRQAVAWLTDVFGFSERLQIADHRSQMNVPGGGAIIVAEYIDRELRPTPGADHVSHQIMVRVEDAQAHYEHVKARGAVILKEPIDYPYGERQYMVQDIGGHRWTFSQTLADTHPSEWGGPDVVLLPE